QRHLQRASHERRRWIEERRVFGGGERREDFRRRENRPRDEQQDDRLAARQQRSFKRERGRPRPLVRERLALGGRRDAAPPAAGTAAFRNAQRQHRHRLPHHPI